MSPVTGGAGRWNSSWLSVIVLTPPKLRDLYCRHEQPAPEMAITAKQHRALNRYA